MNWKKIQERWEAGDRKIAIQLLEQMIYELGLRQAVLKEFLEEVRK